MGIRRHSGPAEGGSHTCRDFRRAFLLASIAAGLLPYSVQAAESGPDRFAGRSRMVEVIESSVAVMTDILSVRPESTVLEVGTGSGYQAAQLAELVREGYTIEISPDLAGTASARLAPWNTATSGRGRATAITAGRSRLSQYKGLSTALNVPRAEVVSERSSPLGLVTVVPSDEIPFRHAPGLSLSLSLVNSIERPRQLGHFTDGDSLSVITAYDGRREPLAYLDFTTAVPPYQLLRRPETLILGAGGAHVLLALYHAASRIEAVELNPDLSCRRQPGSRP